MEHLKRYQRTSGKVDKKVCHPKRRIEINSGTEVVFDTLGININSTIKTPLNTNKNND